MGFLAPYPHVRYHRDQLAVEGVLPPVGREETFNHRHSTLRGIVERQFGIAKKMWKILKEIPSELAKQEGNVVFGGRLGQYRYYDMHQVIHAALLAVEYELG